MRRTAPISVEQFGERFDLGPRAAAGLIRKMRHVEQGKHLWTTEEWLAQWAAAKSVPAQNWPPDDVVYDPLEEAVISRVIAMIGRLAAEGTIKVVAQ